MQFAIRTNCHHFFFFFLDLVNIPEKNEDQIFYTEILEQKKQLPLRSMEKNDLQNNYIKWKREFTNGLSGKSCFIVKSKTITGPSLNGITTILQEFNYNTRTRNPRR